MCSSVHPPRPGEETKAALGILILCPLDSREEGGELSPPSTAPNTWAPGQGYSTLWEAVRTKETHHLGPAEPLPPLVPSGRYPGWGSLPESPSLIPTPAPNQSWMRCHLQALGARLLAALTSPGASDSSVVRTRGRGREQTEILQEQRTRLLLGL